MPHFLFQWQFTSNATKALVGRPQNRSVPARALIEGHGGKMHAYYFAFGPYDGVGICEFPDAVSAAACSLEAASSGGFSRFDTTLLLTPEEGQSAMMKANSTRSGYAPPA